MGSILGWDPPEFLSLGGAPFAAVWGSSNLKKPANEYHAAQTGFITELSIGGWLQMMAGHKMLLFNHFIAHWYTV